MQARPLRGRSGLFSTFTGDQEVIQAQGTTRTGFTPQGVQERNGSSGLGRSQEVASSGEEWFFGGSARSQGGQEFRRRMVLRIRTLTGRSGVQGGNRECSSQGSHGVQRTTNRNHRMRRMHYGERRKRYKLLRCVRIDRGFHRMRSGTTDAARLAVVIT